MAFVNPARPGPESPAELSRSTPLRKRALIVGVAVVGASAITASPATAAVPALATARAHDVQLTAAANPLQTWQNMFNTASGHIQYGLNEMSTLYPQLAQQLLGAAPAVLEEFAGVLTNTAGWQQVLNNLPSYAERIQAAIEASQEQDPNVPDDLPDFNGMLENVAGYLRNQEFNNAFAEFNQYFLWSLGSGAWPLLKELTIGSEILETIGAHRLANVWDAMLVGPDGQGGAVTDFTLFTLGPVVTAAFQFTEGLDDIALAVKAGDWENAVGELLDITPKTLNAFLNGYAPRVSDQPWDWAGFLTNRGTLEYFAFTLPREITWALITPRFPGEEETPALTAASESALPEAISTKVAEVGKLLNLNLGALAPAVEAESAEAESGDAEAGTVVEKVIDKIVNGDETVETVDGEETVENVDGDETVETVDGDETVENVDGGTESEVVETTPPTDSETPPVVTTPVEEGAVAEEVLEDAPALGDKGTPAAESAKTALDNTKSKIRSIRNKLADRFGGKGGSSKPSSSKPGSDSSDGSKSDSGKSDSGKSDSDSSESKSDKSGSDKSDSGSGTDRSKSDSKSGSDSAKSSSKSESKSDRGSDSKRKSKSSDSD